MASAVVKLAELGKKLKVLYVEDDLRLQEELSLLLNDIFEVVDLANNGQEGLDKIEANDYDIVVTDIKMPIMDGIEMITHIREKKIDIPVVVTSAHSETDFFVKLIELNVDSFITKPLRAEQIFNALSKVAINVANKKELKKYKIELENANNKLKERVVTQSKDIDIKNSTIKAYKDAMYEVAVVSITDEKGKIKEINDNFINVYGYSKEEVIGKTHNFLKDSNAEDCIYKELWETLKAKKTWQGILVNRTKSLGLLHHYTTIIPILDDKGDVHEFLAVRYDLSKYESKRYKDIEKAAEVKRADILKFLPFPSAIFHEDLKVALFNDSFEQLLLTVEGSDLSSKLLDKNLKLGEFMELIDFISLMDDDSIEGSFKSIYGDVDFYIKIKQLNDTCYLGCIIIKEEEDYVSKF